MKVYKTTPNNREFKPYEIVITVESEQDEETLREISSAELRIPNVLYYPEGYDLYDDHRKDPKWKSVHDFVIKLRRYFE